MKRIAFALMTLVVVYAAVQLGCMDRQPAPVCPVPTELKADEMQPGGFDGVDLLVMVDDSISMTQEQAILATSFFPLVNSLAYPIHTDYQETNWPYQAAEELRLAVVTSNMGFSSAGEENDDEWPGTMVEACEGLGDNGAFQTSMPASVAIGNDVIPCDDTSAQCPAGWTCQGMEDDDSTPGQGVCNNGTADAEGTVDCPDLGASWAETTDELVDPEFPIKAACLAKQGTAGCGFEQQLQSAATALVVGDQPEFIHDSHLLAILIVSDEEDCSMSDGPGLFSEDEVQHQDEKKVNLACGKHDEYLYEPSYFYEQFTAVKPAQAVVFAAIVGVPYEGDEADACQGPGGSLDNCLEQDSMQLEEEQPGADEEPPDLTWYFRPACERYLNPEDEEPVTRAYPGRRYVELAADSFGDMSYVYSICNDDWSAAMMDIARLIASQMAGTCYKKPLDWDPVNRVAKCNVVVEYVNPEDDSCPDAFGDDVVPIIKEETTDEGEEVVHMFCPIPKIPFDQDCGTQAAELDQDTFGWYYCENLSAENFPEACNDNLDNDGDGATDCDDTGDPENPDDPGCADCTGCPGALGVNCNQTCTYVVMLTDEAQRQIAGLQVSVQCLQQFSFEDKNCQEDTQAACTDSADNDGNGIWDCSYEEDGASTLAEGEKGHLADPNCCPMTGEPGDECDLAPAGVDQLYQDVCPSDEVDYTDGYPDACREAASRLQCSLPPV